MFSWKDPNETKTDGATSQRNTAGCAKAPSDDSETFENDAIKGSSFLITEATNSIRSIDYDKTIIMDLEEFKDKFDLLKKTGKLLQELSSDAYPELSSSVKNPASTVEKFLHESKVFRSGITHLNSCCMEQTDLFSLMTTKKEDPENTIPITNPIPTLFANAMDTKGSSLAKEILPMVQLFNGE